MHCRLEACFREDPTFALRWGSAQVAIHKLIQELRERGWNEQERAHALQCFMRALIQQTEQMGQ
ncbi:hypothetical protein [Synechococcus sp. LA31]|uniref:hypothetical protein n=1 Tax=Synechococcus sp. LA31 TaxID=2741953 RepID=UPI001BDC4041|nr:hypothetical protein [Synechococcus sp. LA31]QVV66765.1 hypothetical protein KJJ24_09740 [Synechococcus sp. LA31]